MSNKETELLPMWNFRNIPKETVAKIAKYCKSRGLSRSAYLQTDPRIKNIK